MWFFRSESSQPHAWRLGRDERGAALVELAVTLPLLAIILVGTIDFGRAFQTAMVVTAAARAGALYGSYSSTRSGDTTGMMNAASTVLTANGLTTGPAPQASRTCSCMDDSGALVGGASVACNTVCVSSHLVVNVTVTATRTFTMLSPFPWNSVTITRGSTLRAQ